MRNLLDILDRPIAFQRRFVDLTGSVTAALFLSQAVYWQKRAKQADGWWYKSADEWTEETGLSRHEQQTAREKCARYLKSDLRGIPATLFWHVEESALSEDLFGESSKTSFTESVKLDLRNQSNINKESETTAETTPNAVAIQKIKKAADKTVDAILANEGKTAGKQWTNLPEIYQPFARAFQDTTGIVYTKKQAFDWMDTFDEWLKSGFQAADVSTAIRAIQADGRVSISRPGSVTWKLRAGVAAKHSAQPSFEDDPRGVW